MNIKQKTSLIALLVLLINPSYARLNFGDAQKINFDWSFHLGKEAEDPNKNFNHSKWEVVNLPHDWSVKQTLSKTHASCMGYLPGGVGWYRKWVDIPNENQNKKVYLYFEGVYNRSEVYINDQLVGVRPNGYVSFAYDITPYIQYGNKNLISVKVDHSQDADSRWYTGSGIYRDVWLVYANPIHIAQWGVFAYSKEQKGQKRSLHVETELENHTNKAITATVLHELIDTNGKKVAQKSSRHKIEKQGKGKLIQQIDINNPQLWSLENPYLYSLSTKVYVDNQQVDQSTITTGFRTFTFDPNKGMAINDKWIKTKGVCIHHDSGVLGAASYKEVWRRRLLALKEIGVNAIRTSHNPQATHLYELCDELGFLVIDEVFDEWKYPKRKWLEGWNVGTPGFQGSYDYFEEWGERDMADIVKRDRNHLSIFTWSIGNEVDYPNDPYSLPSLDSGGGKDFTQPRHGGYIEGAPNAMELGDIAKRLVAAVKEQDSSRPVTAGLAGVAMSNETEYPDALDITGYNYTENRYDTDHKKYPNRVIYGSENRHDFKAWKAVRDNEHIFGQFLWTGIDYLGESGPWPSRGFYSGLVDFGGFIKPRGYFRQTLWCDQPVIHIGTYPTPGGNSDTGMKDVWSQLEAQSKKKRTEEPPSMDAWPIWNYEEAELIRVVCYSNTASMQLILNGKSISNRKNHDDELGMVYWDIPYSDGVLEAVGYDISDNEIVRTSIQSSGRPKALIVENENPIINKDQGIAHIVVKVVDDNNIPVVIADNLITCTIEGNAKLLGLEASNNEDMTDYTDNIHRMYNGKILAYIQANGEEGVVKIKFTSPLLQSVSTEIKIQ